MARVAISEKGAQELFLLSQNLQSSMGDIIQGCETLIKSINGISSDLGIFRSSILSMATENKTKMLEYAGDVELLSKGVFRKANNILSIVRRIKSNSTVSSAAEIARNPSGTLIDGKANHWFDYFGTDSYVPLLHTMQSSNTIILEGKRVNIFDHPFGEQPGRVCCQGSAFPDDGKGNGITGTCGCCACATIINKAGGKASEKTVVSYALKKNLCSNDNNSSPSNRGGTSPNSWLSILGEAGLCASDISGESLSSLASSVENGYGVIIGVSACTICPEWYGQYIPGKADGHAVVLESVIRDADTNCILEYVIADSNGSTSGDAARRIPAKTLEKAFQRQGMRAVVTDEIIW